MSVTERVLTGAAAPRATAPTADGPSLLPPHLLPLAEGGWTVWQLAGLRGAGFPAAEVLKLAAPVLAAVAEELIEAEVEARAAETDARAALADALDALRREGLWEEKERRVPLVKALQQLKAGRAVEAPGVEDGVAAALSNHARARARLDAVSSGVRRAFEAATAEVSRALCEAASSERFREAVIWQNRRAWHSGVKLLLREPPGAARSSKRRQHEELVANYLQRYCVKNDTIGFFGPVGWARFVPHGEAVEVRPGPNLIATRNAYFEGWCVDALAEALARDGSLRPWLAPRRLPFVGLEGEAMTLPGGASLKLPAKDAAVR